ncbi:MAG: hypothetical protein ACRERV_18170 [Methylococcales bacterium]
MTEARSGAFIEMLEGLDIEVDMATFSHALSNTLQLARRYPLSAPPAPPARTMFIGFHDEIIS